ncbi:MAG: sensor histidine kinase [Defluviitaleaceae bacterium]|nr:sensor histidine kinase [Defluviitaleaceae bacterium]
MKNRLKHIILFFMVCVFVLGYTARRRADYYSRAIPEYDLFQLSISALQENQIVQNEIVRYARNLNRFYIHHRNFLNTSDDERISEEDIQNAILNLEANLKIQQETSVSVLNNVLFNTNSTEEEREQALSDFTNDMNRLDAIYISEIEHIRERLLGDERLNFEGVGNYLNTTHEFAYYIHDLVLDEIFTNMPEGEAYLFAVNLSEIDALFNGVPLNRSFSQNEIEGYIFVPTNQPVNSFVVQILENISERNAENLEFWRTQVVRYNIIFLCLVLVFVVLLWQIPKKGFSFEIYERVPLVLKFFSVILASAFLNRFFRSPFDIFIHADLVQITNFAYFIVMSFMGYVFIYGIFYTIKLCKNKGLIKSEPDIKFLNKSVTDFAIMRKYSPHFFPIISFFMFSGIFVLGFIGFTIVINRFYYNMLFVVLTIIILAVIVLAIISLKIIVNYSKLGFYINNISEGSYGDIPPEKEILLNKLSQINLGFKKNLEKMLKSERMKTELITNVSHDLKTPLTSIINYVELLRGLELGEPEKEYTEVLAQKSHRLKMLINDLFEAAKLSSSNIELNYNKINIVQLLQQTLGELDEKIKKSNLDFKITTSNDFVPVMIDGQKMWRVFDNLVGNITKYSKKETRVYVSIAETEKTIEIIMKNISAYELDFDASELFERFKRGDKSRTTEGSGLGLSIAKDIIDLHGGSLNISIDGDLFKTEISLPKLSI